MKRIEILITSDNVLLSNISEDEQINLYPIIIKYNQQILALGDIDEQGLKERIREVRGNENEKTLKKQFKGEELKFQLELLEMTKNDLLYGTFDFWEYEKSEYQFIYPFRVESFDASDATLFLEFITRLKLQKNSNLFTKYEYNIKIEDYDDIKAEEKKEIERSLIKKLYKSKKVFINNREI